MVSQYGSPAGRSLPGQGQISSLDFLAPLPPYAAAAAGMQRIGQPNIGATPENRLGSDINILQSGLRTETAQIAPRTTGEIGVLRRPGQLQQQGGSLQVATGQRDPLSQNQVVSPATTLQPPSQYPGRIATEQELAGVSASPLAGTPYDVTGGGGNEPYGGGFSSTPVGGQTVRDVVLGDLLARAAASNARNDAIRAQNAAQLAQPVQQTQGIAQAQPRNQPTFVTPQTPLGTPPPSPSPAVAAAAPPPYQQAAPSTPSAPPPSPLAPAPAGVWDYSGPVPIYRPAAGQQTGLSQEQALLAQMGLLDPYLSGGSINPG